MDNQLQTIQSTEFDATPNYYRNPGPAPTIGVLNNSNDIDFTVIPIIDKRTVIIQKLDDLNSFIYKHNLQTLFEYRIRMKNKDSDNWWMLPYREDTSPTGLVNGIDVIYTPSEVFINTFGAVALGIKPPCVLEIYFLKFYI